jgi:hypothetical protein
MTRKDSEKDADRPHYYSQFWLDIAAGRRVIGGPKLEEDANEIDIPEPALVAPSRRGARVEISRETRPGAVVEPEIEEEEDFEQEDTVEEDELPNIVLDEEVVEPEADILGEANPEEEAVEEDLFEEDEEDEDEEGWDGRHGGRKKAKPVRQPVKPVKKPKREPRRGF